MRPICGTSAYATICLLALSLRSLGAADPEKPRLDLHGDELPLGAVARFGTVRFRLQRVAASVLLSPDGAHIIAPEADRKHVTVVDALTGKELRRFDTPSTITSDWTFFANGKHLVWCGRNSLYLQDTNSGTVVRRLPVSAAGTGMPTAAVSADGKWLAARDDVKDKARITVWSLENGKRRVTVPAPDISQFHIHAALSPDGAQVAVWGFEDEEFKVYDAASGKQLQQFDNEGRGIETVLFAPNAKQMAVLESGGTISLWDTATGRWLRRLLVPERIMSSLWYSLDGKEMLACGYDSVLRWDAATGRRLEKLSGPERAIQHMAVLPGNRCRLLSLANEGMYVWDLPESKKKSAPEGHSRPVETIRFNRDGKTLHSADGHYLFAWDVATARGVKPRESTRYCKSGCFTLSPGADQILDGTEIYDTKTDQHVASLGSSDYRGEKPAGCFAERAAVCAVCTQAKREWGTVSLVRLWEMDSWLERRLIETEVGTNYALALSPDGKRVALARSGGATSKDAVWTVWDAASGKELWRKTRTNDKIEALLFSPDGEWLATASANGVNIWRADDGKEVRAAALPPGLRPSRLAWSPNGRSLAVAGMVADDKKSTFTVLLVDAMTGKVRAEWKSHRAAVNALAFSPDGKVLASGSDDTTILLWDATENGR